MVRVKGECHSDFKGLFQCSQAFLIFLQVIFPQRSCLTCFSEEDILMVSLHSFTILTGTVAKESYKFLIFYFENMS